MDSAWIRFPTPRASSGVDGTIVCAGSIRRWFFRRSWTSAKCRIADPSITSFFEGGRKQFDGIDSGLATVFDFPLCFALRDVVIKGAPMAKIVDVLRHDELYPHPETLVTFIGNHDDKRFMSEEGSNPAKLKAAFSLLLTLRGIPQIYSGDEIAMPGGDDPDNRRDFPGGFPGDPHNAFTASGRTAEQQDVFAYVQSLLALRKSHPALRTGKHWHIGWDDNYYAFLRESPEEKRWSSTTTPRRRSTSTSPLRIRRLKLRTSCRRCLEISPRKLRAAKCASHCRPRRLPFSACINKV